MVVAHNGAGYLPRVLSALAGQTRPADLVLGADTGSTDGSAQMLVTALGADNVLRYEGPRGYGATVAAVLRRSRGTTPALTTAGGSTVLAAGGNSEAGTSSEGPAEPTEPTGSSRTPAPVGSPMVQEWIWLLHDDAAPARTALAELLEAVERAPSVTVAGCKQLDWAEPRRLVDVGLTANQWFDRFSMVDMDEQDQGQHDARSDVFAVNSAGMLIRRDVWDALGGFDAALPGPGDDLDFCARVRLAGHRVVVVPAARMFHIYQRPHPLGTPTAIRKATVFLRLKHARWWEVPVFALGAFVAEIYRLFAGIVLKAPGHALAMFGATTAGLARPLALTRSRKALSSTRTRPRSVHRGLAVDARDVRLHVRSLRAAVVPDTDDSSAPLDGPLSQEPTGDAIDDHAAPLPTAKSPAILGALALVVGLFGVSLVALSRLIGADAVAGGALLPVSATLGRVWDHASGWWISLGSGLPGRGDPFDFVLWVLAALGLGHGSAAVTWTLLLAVPVSAFTAWLAIGAFSTARIPRLVAALAWAAAPVLQVAIGQGRLGAVLAHLFIPLVLLGLVRAAGGAVGGEAVEARENPSPAGRGGAVKDVRLGKPGTRGIPSWTAAAAAGLALAVVTAGAPSLLPVAVIGVLGATAFLRRRGKTLWWSLIPSLALFAPFAFSARDNLRALVGDPGLPVAARHSPLWQQVLGFPLEIGPHDGLAGLPAFATALPWAWIVLLLVGLPVVLTAVAALLLPLRHAGTVRTLWCVALLALAAAFGSGRLATALSGNTLVTPYNGPAVSVALFALLAAAVLGWTAIYRAAFDPDAPSGRDTALGAGARGRPRRGPAVVLCLVLAAGPVAGLALWTAQNLAGGQPLALGVAPTATIAPSTSMRLPATAADRGNGPEASRTIVLTVSGDSSVQAALMQGSGTTLDRLSTIASAQRIQGLPGHETVAAPDPASAVLRHAVGTIMADSGVDPRPDLTALGVGFVVLQSGDTAAELVASKIDAVPGLETVGPTDAGWLWRVQPGAAAAGGADVVGRVRVTDARGAVTAFLPSAGLGVDTRIPAGPAGRHVVLAERADPGWSARLDGKVLASSPGDWAQAFELPATGGQLDIRYSHPWEVPFNVVQIVLLGLTLLLAIPVRARRGGIGAYRDEASLQKVGKGV